MKRMKIGSFLILFLGLVALAGGMAACEDNIGEEEILTGNDGLVTVPLAFDFASELNGYDVPRARLGLASGSPRARLGLASKEAILPPSRRACPPSCQLVMLQN
ncbi:hypothetical protein [Bacteroides oleiciplenus]|uniref:hypothetical protein n=1 Tax=Bacteroides oleiciplenus TaxID=626931 RepID=UPI0026DB7436|nr:hypothetical protein [Bacteroides oleiciplenus]